MINVRLAKKNGEHNPSSLVRLRERLIVEKIRNGMADETVGRSQNEELAVLRKAVALLFDVVATLHPDEINNEEFAAYYHDIERCKAAVDALLKGGEGE